MTQKLWCMLWTAIVIHTVSVVDYLWIFAHAVAYNSELGFHVSYPIDSKFVSITSRFLNKAVA